jgi:putative intracellular protease/amidase
MRLIPSTRRLAAKGAEKMTVYLYLLDTLADWEVAYLTAEINSRRFFADKNNSCKIIKVGAEKKSIITMGGIVIAPDMTVDEMQLKKEDVLVLPGADKWLDNENSKILKIAKERIANDYPVAAICGATAGLANIGALDNKKHTSNDKEYLTYTCKAYKGTALYQNLPVVSDKNLITASGLNPIEFTYEIMKLLNLWKTETLEAWKDLYTKKEPIYFYKLMESLK